MPKRYYALRLISIWLKTLGLIVALAGIVWAIDSDDPTLGLYVLIIPFAGLVIGVVLWAFSELIMVMIDTEANTRAMVELMMRRESDELPAAPRPAARKVRSLNGMWDED